MSAGVRHERQIAVVTGGSRGIGRAIAVKFAAAGASVAIGGRDGAALEESAAEVRAAGAECLVTVCDVADEGSVGRFGDAVLERFGHVDVVIACAGVGGPTRPLHEITPDEWRECIAIDLDGVYLTFRRFLPSLIERRRGNLLAISSMTGKRPLAGRTPYAAAKMAVIALVRTLAVEVGQYGIRVNSICPGAVEGERMKLVVRRQAEAQGISQEDALRQFTDASPLKRLVFADEIADACVFLASDAAAAITGEDLNVTAGLVMY